LESTQAGIEAEESLLHETAARESSLNTQVLNMEIDLKHTKLENERLAAEKAQIEKDFEDFLQNKEISAVEFKELRAELRDLKRRETRLLQDYADLEEENITLQKQVSNLRSSQVDFEGSKHEVRHLTEEVDLLNQQVEELASLKSIAEKQLEEALESLQAEREQRHQLRKELDAKSNADSMYQLGNLALSMQQGGGSAGDSEATDADEPSSGKEDDSDHMPVVDNGPSGPPGDLFSEIHGGEIRKLERRAEAAEAECEAVSAALSESRSAAEKAGAASRSAVAAAARLAGLVAGLERLQEEAQFGDVAGRQLMQLRNAVRDFEKSAGGVGSGEGEDGRDTADGLAKLRTEVIQLRRDLVGSEQRSGDLTHDVRILEKVSSDSLRALGDTQLELSGVQAALTGVYERVCRANGQTPSRIMLMRSERARTAVTPSKGVGVTDTTTDVLLGKLKLSKGVRRGLERVGDAGTVKSNVETIKDQMR